MKANDKTIGGGVFPTCRHYNQHHALRFHPTLLLQIIMVDKAATGLFFRHSSLQGFTRDGSSSGTNVYQMEMANLESLPEHLKGGSRRARVCMYIWDVIRPIARRKRRCSTNISTAGICLGQFLPREWLGPLVFWVWVFFLLQICVVFLRLSRFPVLTLLDR